MVEKLGFLAIAACSSKYRQKFWEEILESYKCVDVK